ncbi:MAG: hypothetical protein ACYC9L_10910 [Sulfuricaulis sp.]
MSKYLHVEKPFLGHLAALEGRDGKQKRHFVTNLLQELRRENMVRPDGATRGAKWRLYKSGPDAKS